MSLRVSACTEACRAACERARELGVYAVVRLQDKVERAIGVVNGRTDLKSVEEVSGVGVQVFTEDWLSGFASSDIVTPGSLVDLVESAARLARESRAYGPEPAEGIARVRPLVAHVERAVSMGMDAIGHDEESGLVAGICRMTMEIDSRLAVRTFYRIVDEEWRIVRSDGGDVMFSMPRAAVMNMITARRMSANPA